MKKVIFALLAILYLVALVGCPPSGANEKAFGPGPDRTIDDNGDNGDDATMDDDATMTDDTDAVTEEPTTGTGDAGDDGMDDGEDDGGDMPPPDEEPETE